VDHLARDYATRTVPRYTSYPTAADFTPTITASDHKAWLDNLDVQDSVSVYLYVPYCREIRLYSGCNTKMAIRDDVVSRYRHRLKSRSPWSQTLSVNDYGYRGCIGAAERQASLGWMACGQCSLRSLAALPVTPRLNRSLSWIRAM